MDVQTIRNNIRDQKYTAKDPILEPIAYQHLHRMNHVEASPDERRAAREELKRRGRALIEQFRTDLEEAFEVHGHPRAEVLWQKAWDAGHAHGLYEVLGEYEDLLDIIL